MRRSEPTRQRRSRPHKMPRTRAVKRVRKDCIAFLRGAVVSGQPHCATENATLQLVSLVAACRGRADETRWLVFATLEGKVGHRWYLWAVQSAQAVVFLLDPGRAHDVPEDHLGPEAFGILNVDRYSAYKAMTQVKEGRILLAF